MTVDARPASPTIRRSAMRQSWEPVSLGTLNPDCMGPMCDVILARITRWHRDRGVGCYLFITEDRSVFVIPDDKPCAEQWVKARFASLVGYYEARPSKGVPRRLLGSSPWLCATLTGITEDVADHMAGRA